MSDKHARKRLAAAFRALRKKGFIAKQNFACCSSCGGRALWDDAARRIDAGEPVPLGFVFYHVQDADDRDDGSDFYLSYGEGNPDEPDQPVTTTEVGRRIIATLFEHRIETDWCGDPDIRIKVRWRQMVAN